MSYQNNIKELYEKIFIKINDVIPYARGSSVKKEIDETSNMILKANESFQTNKHFSNDFEIKTYEFYYNLCNGCMIIFHLLDDVKNIVEQQNIMFYEKAIEALDEADKSINNLMDEDYARAKIENFLVSSKATIEYYRALIIIPTKNSGIR